MTLSLWRYAHLALAIVSSLFLLILAVTGVILAVDAVYEDTAPHRTADLDQITLAQSLTGLRNAYPEIIEINIDHNQSVSIDAIDGEGNAVKGYIHPLTGEVLGEVVPKNDFVQWNIALHRSLFLKETGRITVGIVSFLLFLITISGIILIAKRQQGLRNFFNKVHNDFFSQYFHVVSGRALLIPVLMLSLTGTYLFLAKLDFLDKESIEIEHAPQEEALESIPLAEFPFFQQTALDEVEKIEFPFMPDDPEEHFVLKLRDRTVSVSQINGQIVSESRLAPALVWEKLNLDLHTGRTNIVWAIILGLASLNIVAFLYTGFAITLKRTRTKVKNRFKPDTAEIVILVGSENGSTLFFANQIHKQLLADGQKSYLTELNQYGTFPQAKKLLVFTSTYGLGTAPTSASHFESLLAKHPQKQAVTYSVVGFGSRSYPDFCAYAEQVDALLAQQPWASRFVRLHCINDRSVDEFIPWVHAWSEKSLHALATAPAVYSSKVAGLRKLKVIEKTAVTEDNSTFKVLLKPSGKNHFTSGDLLAIYPAHDHRERFYSIGKNGKSLQLIVKLIPDGLGSGYLHRLEKGQTIKARILGNPNFHFPKQAPAVVMLANGTGVAPFLGMILHNKKSVPLHLYTGLRHCNSLAKEYQDFAQEQIGKNHLTRARFAFSRDGEKQYIQDLVREDADFFVDLLKNKGVIMICGSLVMQRDVEKLLGELLFASGSAPLDTFKANQQILTDCY